MNERPTAICLTSPQPHDDCSVVGHIFIEDLDYPELQCKDNKTIDVEKVSSELSEYTCHIQKDKRFYIRDSPPRLYVNTTIFADGDTSYDVPIVCRSTKHAPHILSTNLQVEIKGNAVVNLSHFRFFPDQCIFLFPAVPDDPSCRDASKCAQCPQPKFCLTHVQAAGK